MTQRRRILGTILVMTGTFLAAMDITIVGTAMPTIIGELGGIDRYAWIFSAYLLTSTVVTPVFGRMADMFGRKLIYFGALVAFVTFSMLCGTSRSIDELIVFRALQGLGAGALLPTGFTIVGDLYDRQTRAKAIGLFSSVWIGAAIVGPAIGGFLTQTLSWRWTFYVNLPVGLIALALLVFAYRDTGEHHRQGIDWLGTAVFTGSATALMLGFNGVAPFFTVPLAIVLAVLFVRIEQRAEAPMIDLALVRDPLIASVLALTLLVGAVQFGFTSYVPPFIQGVLGGQPAEAGIALGAMSIGWSVGATAVGWIMLRTGIRRVVTAGSAMLAGSALGLVLLTPGSAIPLVGALGVLAGLGLGWVSAPPFVAIQTSVGYRQRGTVTSLTQFARTLGGATGVAAFGSLLTAELGPRAAQASVLLDPIGRGSADPVALEAIRGGLASGLHAIYVAMLVLAVIVIALARRLPEEMPAEAARDDVAAAG